MLFPRFKKLMPNYIKKGILLAYLKLPICILPISILYCICRNSKNYEKIRLDCIANVKLLNSRPPEFCFWLFCFFVLNHASFRSLIVLRLGLHFPLRRLLFPVKGLGITANSNLVGGGLAILHGWDSLVGAEKIGDNCLIAQNVMIVRGDHGYPTIGNDVHINAGATIFGKVKIGNGAQISVGAVVNQNVPPYAVVVGNPGKIVGFTKSPSEIIEYELSKYSEDERMSYENAKNNYNKYFLSRLDEIKKTINL